MIRPLVPLFLVLFATPALPGCGGRGPRPAPAGPTIVGPENLAVVRRESLELGPRLAGVLEPRRRSILRAEVGGTVVALKVDLGESVREGQLLARIEDRALRDAQAGARAAVAAATGDARVARRQAERAESLARAGAIAPQELETTRAAAAAARARLEEARARLAAAARQLDAATLESPMAGVVSARDVHEGDVVVPGASLLTVIDPTSVRLEASVPAEHLASLSVGAPVRFEVRGYSDERFEGVIERIAPAADPVTRQIALLVSIPNPGQRLLAGLFAEGRVVSRRRDALVVPATALDETGATPTVARVRGGRVERVAVKVGAVDPTGQRVEVGGLVEGDRVLVGTARTLPPGTEVELGPSASGTEAAGDAAAPERAPAAGSPRTGVATDAAPAPARDGAPSRPPAARGTGH